MSRIFRHFRGPVKFEDTRILLLDLIFSSSFLLNWSFAPFLRRFGFELSCKTKTWKTFIPWGIILEGRRCAAESRSGRHLCEILPKSPLFANWHRISRPDDHHRWSETMQEWFLGHWRAFERNRKWRRWRWLWRLLAPLVDWSALFGWHRCIRRGFLFPTSYCTTSYVASFRNGGWKGTEKGRNFCAGVVSEWRHLERHGFQFWTPLERRYAMAKLLKWF